MSHITVLHFFNDHLLLGLYGSRSTYAILTWASIVLSIGGGIGVFADGSLSYPDCVRRTAALLVILVKCDVFVSIGLIVMMFLGQYLIIGDR